MAVGRNLLALVLASCLALGALAGPDTPRQHPLTNLPPAGVVTAGYFFPDFPTKHFPAGEVVKVVLGLRNDAAEPYNVSAILGSLNSPIDFKRYFYNFTQQVYFQVVEPGKELSVEYVFVPPKQVPPTDYQIALTVFYEGAEGLKSTTFFNQTVEIVEVKKLIDTDLIMLYILLISLMAVGVWYVWGWLKEGPLKGMLGPKKKAKKQEKTKAVRADDDDEWVKGTPYDTFRKRKAAAGVKSSGNKSS